MSERDLAEAIHREIISPESVEHAVNLWNERAQIMSRQQRMLSVLARTSANAIDRVLARRQSEAARREERELRALDEASYLVVKEADDGSWLNEPEMFDTRDEATKYLRKIRGRGLFALAEVALYECRELIVPEDDC